MKYFLSFAIIFLISGAFFNYASAALDDFDTRTMDGDAERSALDGDTERSALDGDAERSALDGEDGSGAYVTLKNPLAADNIIELFETIIDIVLIFAVPLIVFFIIYAGFLYVTARGNEGTIEKAHKALLYALIGGLLILGARVLIDVVQGTVDCVRGIDGECQ